MTKNSRIIYFLITTGLILINLYFYNKAQQCGLPENGYQTLCGSGSVLFIGVSSVIWAVYTSVALVRFVFARFRKK